MSILGCAGVIPDYFSCFYGTSRFLVLFISIPPPCCILVIFTAMSCLGYFTYMLILFILQFSTFQYLSACLSLCYFQLSISFCFQLFSYCCYIYVSAISSIDRLFLIRLEQISQFTVPAQQFLQLLVLNFRFCIVVLFRQLGSLTLVLASCTHVV